jgi:hypothetical protein
MFSGFVYFQTREELKDSKKDVYILVNDKQLVRATRTDIKDSYNLLCESHLVDIHKLLYNIIPNSEHINSQLNEALEKGDRSIRTFIEEYKENNFYKSAVGQGYYTFVNKIDVELDYSQNPHKFKVDLTYEVVRGNVKKVRRVTTSGTIKRFVVKKGTETGFYIENFNLVNDKVEQ